MAQRGKTETPADESADVARRFRKSKAQETQSDLDLTPPSRVVTGPPTSDRSADLERKQRNLLLLRPLFEFALKIRHEVNGELYEGLDTQYVALTILDFIMESGALGQGRTRNEILGFGGDVVRGMKPSLTDDSSRTVAREVLDALHNVANRHERFEYTYFDAAKGTNQPYRFALLRYERAEDEAYYYRATDEGFLVYLSMLDLGAANMQELMDKMLHELIRRGRVSDAVQVSNQAYRQGLRYFEQIRTTLDSATRVPGRVSWITDIEPELERSREHLNKRLSEQQILSGVVVAKLVDAKDDDARANLAYLNERLEQEKRIGANLDTLLAEAAGRYMKAQAAAFRVRPKQPLPDLEETVLPELLGFDVTTLADAGDRMGYTLLGVDSPRLLDFNTLFERLLEPQPEDIVAPEEEGERVAIEEIPPHFSKADLKAADEFLRGTFETHAETDILAVLKAAEAAGHDSRVLAVMAFRMYEAFAPKETPYPVTARAEGRFDHPLVTGSKLVFTRDEDPT